VNIAPRYEKARFNLMSSAETVCLLGPMCVYLSSAAQVIVTLAAGKEKGEIIMDRFAAHPAFKENTPSIISSTRGSEGARAQTWFMANVCNKPSVP